MISRKTAIQLCQMNNCSSISTHIYIYIYIKLRDRERERERARDIYAYIYILLLVITWFIVWGRSPYFVIYIFTNLFAFHLFVFRRVFRPNLSQQFRNVPTKFQNWFRNSCWNYLQNSRNPSKLSSRCAVPRIVHVACCQWTRTCRWTRTRCRPRPCCHIYICIYVYDMYTRCLGPPQAGHIYVYIYNEIKIEI